MPSLETAPGVDIHWEEAGAGRPLVLVHGWSMTGRTFAFQADALAAGHRVVRHDLRGHGRSSAAMGAMAVGDHARDLAALFEALDLRGAVLVGWSMGGQVALEALPALAGRVAALALLSVTPCFTQRDGWPHGQPAASVRALAARLRHRPAQTLARFFEQMFVEGELADGQLAEIAARTVAGEPPCGLEAALAGLEALRDADQRPRLATVRVPTLLLHGEHDPICPPAASAFAQEHLPAARRWVLPGTGHAPPHSHPALVSELLARLAAEAA